MLSKLLFLAYTNYWSCSWGYEPMFIASDDGKILFVSDIKGEKKTVTVSGLLFNHNFAKAVFGEDQQKVYGGIWNACDEKPTTVELHEVPAWMYHLQQLVILPEDMRIQYAWENRKIYER